jgi:S1-C subfamily serine protease
MPIELRILTGSRGGLRERFDQRVIALGRHLQSDLRFDPDEDLDVSAKHAEIVRDATGSYRIRDVASTNGTFLNGRRIAGEETLNDGDVIWLGAEGPQVAVHLLDGATRDDAAAIPATAVRPSGPRPSTGERVRLAVRRETAWMRRLIALSLVVLVGGVGAAYWVGHRSSQTQVEDLLKMLAESESTSAQIEARLSSIGDTTFASALRQQNAALAARIRSDGATATPEQLNALRQEIAQQQVVQQGLAMLDLSAISARNDPAIAFLVTELDGKPYGGTAFGITSDGMLVTNRHNVISPITGKPATRLGIEYANTDVLLHAHTISVATEKDVDLAVVKVDEPGTYPVVAGIARSSADVHVGSPVVTIGFPHALETPMDGSKVKTSLTAGTVSKLLPGLVQLDAYASHGSSGSPVFDARGLVIGVIYGGEAASSGRLTYAVTSDRLVGMVPDAVIRP